MFEGQGADSTEIHQLANHSNARDHRLPRPRITGPLGRVVAVGVWLVFAASAITQLGPGNQDDKTLHFASSALLRTSAKRVTELLAYAPALIKRCEARAPGRPGSAETLLCKHRTGARIGVLFNYPSASLWIYLTNEIMARSHLASRQAGPSSHRYSN